MKLILCVICITALLIGCSDSEETKPARVESINELVIPSVGGGGSTSFDACPVVGNDTIALKDGEECQITESLADEFMLVQGPVRCFGGNVSYDGGTFPASAAAPYDAGSVDFICLEELALCRVEGRAITLENAEGCEVDANLAAQWGLVQGPIRCDNGFLTYSGATFQTTFSPFDAGSVFLFCI